MPISNQKSKISNPNSRAVEDPASSGAVEAIILAEGHSFLFVFLQRTDGKFNKISPIFAATCHFPAFMAIYGDHKSWPKMTLYPWKSKKQRERTVIYRKGTQVWLRC